MRHRLSGIGSLVALVWAVAGTGLTAQQSPLSLPVLTPVPRVMWFSGVFRPTDQMPLASVETLTVTVYRDREGGEGVWRETHQVTMDANGRYSLLLGSTFTDGMPLEVFTSGEPRWIGITVHRPGEAEQPRVHLASVPYALKAADADTLAGLPASAYVLAQPAGERDGRAARAGSGTDPSGPPAAPSPGPVADVVLPGTTNFLAKYVNADDVGNSAVYEASGRVGIGTTTPADALHLRFTNPLGSTTGLAVQNLGNTATSYSGMLFYDQFGALAQFQGFNNVTHEYRINNIATNGSINFMTGSISRFLVANNGNIGLGTFPDFKLHVMASSNTGLRVQTGTAGGTVASFGSNGDFQIDAPNIAAGRFVVKEDGHVGIGTVAPSAMLDIQGGADADAVTDPKAMAFGYRLGGFRHWIRTRHNANIGTDNAIDFFVNNSNDADGSTGPAVGSTHVMTLDSGRVGIGTTAPQYALHVVGEAVRVQGNQSFILPRFSLNFTGAGVDEGRWQNYAAPNRLSFTALNDPENSETFWLLVNRGVGTAISSVTFPNGNVGIGTIAPTATLEVKVGGTTLADAWTLRSSARFKSNIQTIPFALNKLLQLRGVTFDYTETQKHSMGFIAEEVGRVLPDVVEYEANGRDAKGLDYNRLTPVVVEAIKEQQQEIQEQRLTGKRQQLRIDSQQKQIDEQQAFIRKRHFEIETLIKRLGEIERLACSQNPTAEICKRED